MNVETNLNGLVALLESESLEENQDPEYVPVPLTEVSIQVRVVNFTAQVIIKKDFFFVKDETLITFLIKVEVTQKYENKERNPIEAIYFFPEARTNHKSSCTPLRRAAACYWSSHRHSALLRPPPISPKGRCNKKGTATFCPHDKNGIESLPHTGSPT